MNCWVMELGSKMVESLKLCNFASPSENYLLFAAAVVYF